MHDVVALAEKRAAALAAEDWEAVAAQLHPAFLYVNANGHRLDRDAYLAFLRDGPLRWKRQRLEDVSVTSAGYAAVLVASVVDDVLYDGEPAEWRFVTTQAYVLDGGAWLYFAGHTALPAAN